MTDLSNTNTTSCLADYAARTEGKNIALRIWIRLGIVSHCGLFIFGERYIILRGLTTVSKASSNHRNRKEQIGCLIHGVGLGVLTLK